MNLIKDITGKHIQSFNADLPQKNVALIQLKILDFTKYCIIFFIRNDECRNEGNILMNANTYGSSIIVNNDKVLNCLCFTKKKGFFRY